MLPRRRRLNNLSRARWAICCWTPVSNRRRTSPAPPWSSTRPSPPPHRTPRPWPPRPRLPFPFPTPLPRRSPAVLVCRPLVTSFLRPRPSPSSPSIARTVWSSTTMATISTTWSTPVCRPFTSSIPIVTISSRSNRRATLSSKARLPRLARAMFPRRWSVPRWWERTDSTRRARRSSAKWPTKSIVKRRSRTIDSMFPWERSSTEYEWNPGDRRSLRATDILLLLPVVLDGPSLSLVSIPRSGVSFNLSPGLRQASFPFREYFVQSELFI